MKNDHHQRRLVQLLSIYLPRIELSAVGVDAHKEQLCLAECHLMVWLVGWLVMQLSSGGCNQMCHRQIVTRSIHQETPQRRSKVCHCGNYKPKALLTSSSNPSPLSLLLHTALVWQMVTLCAHIYLLDQDRVAIKFAVHREGTIAVTQILVHSFTDKCKICAKLIKLDRSCVAVREKEGGKEW